MRKGRVERPRHGGLVRLSGPGGGPLVNGSITGRRWAAGRPRPEPGSATYGLGATGRDRVTVTGAWPPTTRSTTGTPSPPTKESPTRRGRLGRPTGCGHESSSGGTPTCARRLDGRSPTPPRRDPVGTCGFCRPQPKQRCNWSGARFGVIDYVAGASRGCASVSMTRASKKLRSSATTWAPAWQAPHWTAASRSSAASASAGPQAQRSAPTLAPVPPAHRPAHDAARRPARQAPHRRSQHDRRAPPDTMGRRSATASISNVIGVPASQQSTPGGYRDVMSRPHLMSRRLIRSRVRGRG